MKKKVKALAAAIVLLSSAACNTGNGYFATVGQMLEKHPAMTLQDIYKSFYQDRFGPGHMISDRASAMEYLQYELSLEDCSEADIEIEAVGDEGNYLRIPLGLVKNGTISRELLLDAFLLSAEGTQTDKEAWKAEWPHIAAAAAEYRIDGLGSDLRSLDSLLALPGGDYAVHHSRAYSEAYHPHYRIVSRPVYEEMIAPLLPQQNL